MPLKDMKQLLEYTGGSNKAEDIYKASGKYGFTAEDVARVSGKPLDEIKRKEQQQMRASSQGGATSSTQAMATGAMPKVESPDFTPTMQNWNPKNTSVYDRVVDMGDKGGPLMRQAGARGLQVGNRRGLLSSNSSIEAGQEAAYDILLPMASQESGQAHQSNMQNRDLQAQETFQIRGLKSNQYMQERDIGSREWMQGRDITSREGMQDQDIASREGMQETDIEANIALLEREIGSREMLQEAQIAAEKEMLGQQLTSQDRIALRELEAAQERLGIQISADQLMQQRDFENRREMQQADSDIQMQIAGMNIASHEKENAASMAASFEQTYASQVSAITNNPEIPEAARQRYLNHAANVRDSNLALIEQMYGIDLQWETPAVAAGGTA